MDSSVISAIAIWIIFVAGICIISEWCSFNKPSVSKIDILDQKIDDFFETMKIQMKQEFKKKFLKEDFGNTLNMHEYTHIPPQSGFKMSQDESDLITRTNEILYSRIPFDANKKIDFDTPVVKSEPSRYTPGIDSNYNFDPTYTNNIKTKYEQVKNVYSVLPSDTFSSNLFTI